MYFREIGWGRVERIDMAEDKDQWRALVNTVMKLGFYKIFVNS
jgi:hypothetical protein